MQKLEQTSLTNHSQTRKVAIVLPKNDIENYSLKASNAMCSLILFYMSIICDLYVLVCRSNIIRISVVCARFSTICHSYVIRMSLVCGRMSSVSHSYILVCHPYVTRIYSYVTRMSLACGFTMSLFEEGYWNLLFDYKIISFNYHPVFS